MQITQDSVVLMHYTLTNSEGTVLDSSEGREPLPYLHGHGNIVVGLETELADKKAGDKLDVKVAAADGYGPQYPELVQEVPQTAFEGLGELKVGMEFTAETQAGPTTVRIAEVKEETVMVDGNHPLAGEELHFAVEVVEVRTATAEELEHGHVHGPGGHEH